MITSTLKLNRIFFSYLNYVLPKSVYYYYEYYNLKIWNRTSFVSIILRWFSNKNVAVLMLTFILMFNLDLKYALLKTKQFMYYVLHFKILKRLWTLLTKINKTSEIRHKLLNSLKIKKIHIHLIWYRGGRFSFVKTYSHSSTSC